MDALRTLQALSEELSANKTCVRGSRAAKALTLRLPICTAKHRIWAGLLTSTEPAVERIVLPPFKFHFRFSYNHVRSKQLTVRWRDGD